MSPTAKTTDRDTTLGVGEQAKLLESILQRLLFRDTYGIPKICSVGENIKDHLQKMDNYFKSCGIENKEAKTTVLLNSITDEMQLELCGLLEFQNKKNDYEWLSKKLVDLYQPKESELSPYIKLFSHKQRCNQSTREFLAEIRREGYKLLHMLDSKEREKHMIEAFCAGIANHDLRKVLRHRKFDTLDEAYELIKKERPTGNDEDGLVRAMISRNAQEQVSDIEKLQNQVSVMQKQLAYIVSLLQSESRPSPQKASPTYAQMASRNFPERRETRPVPRRYMPQYDSQRERTRSTVCFCCGREGHIARMCDVRCENCGRQGHKANRCYSRQQAPRKNVRVLEELGNNEWVDCETSSVVPSSTGENLDEVIHQEIPSVSSVYVEEETIEAKRPELKKMTSEFISRKPRIYPEEVNQWANFIEGRTNRKPKTLISSNRSEKAANKPIIEGKCNGLACKILCDSGAEVNVIDETFVREIQAADAGVIISKARKAIKCANNSAMHVVGSVRLRMSFTAISAGKPCTFLIVKNLFPKVILGIRSMKELEMTIDPPHSQVVVKGKRISFLSKVYAETVVGQGNEDQSVLRVGGRQMYA